jgi:hypothetical protein
MRRLPAPLRPLIVKVSVANAPASTGFELLK